MKKPDCASCRMENHGEFIKNSFEKCSGCERIKKYEAHLSSKRLFNEGPAINSIEELLKHEWVLVQGRGKHMKAVINMTLSMVLIWIERGYFKTAIRKDRQGGRP